jgi:multiple sugar transport system ATP-binding protein
VLYDHPVNEFVAGFIGSPAINLVEAQLQQTDGHYSVAFGEHRLAIEDRVVRNRSGLNDYVGTTIMLGIRPEDFRVVSPGEETLRGTVTVVERLGRETLAHPPHHRP